MGTEQTELVERIRTLIPGDEPVREVAMFGGRAIMFREKMLVSAGKDGTLLVRVDSDRHAELLRRPGAVQATMGPERNMGPGWIQVAADAIAAEDQLAQWIEIAMEYNRRVSRS